MTDLDYEGSTKKASEIAPFADAAQVLPKRSFQQSVSIWRTDQSVAPVLPYVALTFGVLALGLSAIFVKWANAPGPVSGFYRMVIAGAVIALPFGIQARRQAPLSKRHILLAALAGLFFAGDLASWNSAVLITSAANATLLGNSSPLWVSLGALVLFKEKLRPAFWAGLFVVLVGSTVILGEDFLLHPSFGIGDLLSLMSGFFYGCFLLATERARDKLSSLVSWWVSAAAAAGALFLVSVFFGFPLVGYGITTWQSLIALALITQVGGWLALNYALGHLPASLVSPSLLGQPVLTALFAVPLLGQSLSRLQIGGGLLVLAGIWIVHRAHH